MLVDQTGELAIHLPLLFWTYGFGVVAANRMDYDARVLSLQEFEIPFRLKQHSVVTELVSDPFASVRQR